MALSNSSTQKLWTKNFSILILGSLISMAGSTVLATFFGLYMVDISGSGLLFSLMLIISNAAQIVVPLLVGVRVEKIPKEKIIYTMDFTSAGFFFLLGILCSFGLMSPGAILLETLVIDSISAVYLLAFNSLFPAIVKKENFTKAYSVASFLSNICEASGFIGIFGYNFFGPVPVMFFCSGCFLLAAIFETRIHPKGDEVVKEYHTLVEGKGFRALFANYRFVFKMMKENPGFKELYVSFVLDAFRTGAFWAMVLPFLEWIYSQNSIFGFSIDPDYVYVVLLGCYSVGQFICGVCSYILNTRGRKRFWFIVGSILVESTCIAIFPFFSFAGSILWLLLAGFASVISLCTFETGFFERVPGELRARFNGVFVSSQALAMILGNLIGGLLLDYFAYPKFSFLLTALPEMIFVVVMVVFFRKRLMNYFSYEKESSKAAGEEAQLYMNN